MKEEGLWATSLLWGGGRPKMRSVQRLFCVGFVVVCFGFQVVWLRWGRGFPSWLCMSQNQLQRGSCHKKPLYEREAMQARASRDCTELARLNSD